MHPESGSQGSSAAVAHVENLRGLSTDKAFADLYRDLRRMAKRRLASGRPDRLMQTTGLIHEVYLRLVRNGAMAGEAEHWVNRFHFLAAASDAMRYVVLDRARSARCIKRGGGQYFVSLCSEDEPEDHCAESESMWKDLDNALDELEQEDATTAQLELNIGFGDIAILTVSDGGLIEVGGVLSIDFGGTLTGGGGVVKADVFNNGLLSPGNSTGQLTIEGNYIQADFGILEIELVGLLEGFLYDQLVVAGDAQLGGELAVSLTNGFQIGLNQSFNILKVDGTLTGVFDGLEHESLVGTFDGIDLFISYTASGPAAGRAALYSSRAQ